MEQNKKPPIGLVPKEIREAINNKERYLEISEALSRYYNAGKKIPISWIEEYNDLVEKIIFKETI